MGTHSSMETSPSMGTIFRRQELVSIYGVRIYTVSIVTGGNPTGPKAAQDGSRLQYSGRATYLHNHTSRGKAPGSLAASRETAAVEGCTQGGTRRGNDMRSHGRIQPTEGYAISPADKTNTTRLCSAKITQYNHTTFPSFSVSMTT